MTYPQTIEWLYSRLPIFQRQGSSAYRPGLERTVSLLAELGNPQDRLRIVHVAGTNGKGSTSHLIAAVLQAAGYKTGLYTSPHLKDFRERIRIDGQMVGEAFIVDFVEKCRPLIERIEPSFFEVTVAMAFEAMATAGCEWAVIETGMGGRLDSTNVADPQIAVITNVGYDHMEQLGHTLPEIAGEKAGIIKAGRPILIGERQPEVEAVFRDRAEKVGAPIRFADEFEVPDYPTQLLGQVQIKNRTSAYAAVKWLSKKNVKIEEKYIEEGFAEVVNLTGLKGRWQVLGTEPLVVADVGHNLDGVRVVVDEMARQSVDNWQVVWGMVGDKDVASIVSILPRTATYYLVEPSIARRLPVAQLAEQFERVGLNYQVVGEVNEGLALARQAAAPSDGILVGGSTFVVADLQEV